MTMSDVLELNDQDFDQAVLKENQVALVDFWAPWCGPCKVAGPIVDEVAQEIGEKAVVAKVNVDENPILSGRYKVMSIPTMLLFKDGKIVDQLVGLQPKEVLLSKIESALK